MTINRHNYEEFFLLYVDSELSAADRQTVEQFVQANPDLANELEMFQQVQLTPDAVAFDDKDVLYKNGSAEITLNNYGEQFLLYVDNELSASAKSKVETFVLQHPSLQETFTILKQTRLEPETIFFPNKQSLYRKEGKEKPVIYLRWTKVAVAAALTGLAVLVWTLVPNKTTPEQNLARLNTTPGPADQKNAVANKAGNDTKVADKNTANMATVATLNKKVSGLPVINKNNHTLQNAAPSEKIQNPVTRNTSQPAPVETGKTDVAIIESAPPVVISSPNEQSLTERKASLINNDVIASNTISEDNPALTNPVKQAVYKELDTEDDKKSLYLGSIEINKDKLRGFFRKAGSLFRGKAKQQQEDEKSESGPATNTRSLK